MVHQVVKPEKIAATAAVLLEQQLVVPAVFRREGIDQYKGAKDDTIKVIVEGVLPYRTYGWRNDRSTEIQFDEYKKRKVAVKAARSREMVDQGKFGGDIYNGVRLTDEQNEFDLPGWAKLASKQTEALGRGLEYQATDYALNAPYEVTLGIKADQLRRSLIRARATMRALRVPPGPRTMLIAPAGKPPCWTTTSCRWRRTSARARPSRRCARPRWAAGTVSISWWPTNSRRPWRSRWSTRRSSSPPAPRPSRSPCRSGRPPHTTASRCAGSATTTPPASRTARFSTRTRGSARHRRPDRPRRNHQAGVRQPVRTLRPRHQAHPRRTDSLPNGKTGRPAEGFSKEQDAELAAITGLGTKATIAGP